ncbi:MAG: hypothetical protein QGH60_02490 [Phycisphaerae bacterium]|jgi:hypothetical protein|nr:hypothetical protein [Phycisphaerae bacterium]
MSDDRNNQERLKLLDAALRRDLPLEEPLTAELEARIVASIRAEPGRRGRALTFRRFAITSALAAGVLLAITLLVINRLGVNPPQPIAPRNTDSSNGDIFEKIPPAPVIVDNSLTAVEEFAAGSVVQEMRYLARDASDIGSAVLASLPVDVGEGGRSQWWNRLLER